MFRYTYFFTAGQKIILNLWQERATGPLHVLHFGFGMGSFIVPQIANPFLAVVDDVSRNTTNVTSLGNMSTVSTTTVKTKYLKDSRIETPYLIVGIIVATVSLAFYIYQFCCRRVSSDKSSEKSKEEGTLCQKAVKVVDPATCANGDRVFSVQVFVLLFFYFFNLVGGERLYGKFIRSYAIDKHKFSGDDGSLINTEFWISFAIGRFTGLFTGRFIPIRILIFIEVVGVLVCAILLEIFARDSSLALWILTVPMGFFVAPLFPSGIGWGDFHVEFTGFAITFVLMGGALGGITYLWVIGYLYEYQGYDMFLHQLVVYGAVAVVLVIILNIIGKRHGGRFENVKDDVEFEEKWTDKSKDGIENVGFTDITEMHSNKEKQNSGSDQNGSTHM